MNELNNTSDLNTSVATLEAPKPAAPKARQPKPEKKVHALGEIKVFTDNGLTYADLSMFGLSNKVRIGGGGTFVTPTSLRSIMPKVDRLSKTDDVHYDVDDAAVDAELVGNAAYTIAALLGASPKCHAKPVGTKGNTRKDRLVALREGNRGRGIRLA